MMRCSLSLLPLAALLAALPALAQTAPDAGQTLQELERPSTPKSRPVPTLTLPTEGQGAADSSVRFVVKDIRLEADSGLDTAPLQAELASLAGREVSLADLWSLARRLTGRLRQDGYALARVIVPAQEIRDGAVRLQILDGQLGKVATDNRSRLDSAWLEGLLAAQVPPGEPLKTAPLDRALLLAADLPGAGPIAGSLAPGDRVGTSDLTLAVAPGKPFDGEISADNHGNRYTGQQRLSARLDANSPSGRGDRLRASATASDQALYYGRLAYDLPLGTDGLRLGAALSRSRYDLGKEFEALDAHGTATTASLFGTYPLLRRRDANVAIGASLERRELTDRIDSIGTRTDKAADVLNLSLDGDWQDGMGGGGASRWRLAAASGRLAIDTPAAKTADAAGLRSAGRYTKGQALFQRLQALAPATRLYAALQAQWADKNLDSSEKITLGGAYGVRAYPQGEGVGDRGLLATLELRRDLLAGLEARLFYDWAEGRASTFRYAAGANRRILAGHGFGLAWSQAGFFANAQVAWRDRQAAFSAPDRSPRAWIQVGWQF